MPRIAEQLLLAGQFDQASEVHHAHLVAHMAHHRQVVRDEKVSEAALALQVLHDVEHLGLHAHVQRRGRLVAHQEFRLGRQRPGDRNALPLAARELVRVLRHVERRESHRLEQFAHPLRQLAAVGDDAVLLHRLADDVFHDPARIQAGVGVLEDHLDAPAQLAPLRRLERGMRVLPVERQAAPGRLVQPHQQPGHRALAAARLADQRQGLALADFETHPVHGMQQLARAALDDPVEPGRRHVEDLGQIVGLHQRRAHAGCSAWASCSQQAARVAPAFIRSGRSTTQRWKARGQRGL